MKKLLKRALSVLLSICIIFSTSVVGFASASFDYLPFIQYFIDFWKTVDSSITASKKANDQKRFEERGTVFGFWLNVLKKYPMSKEDFVTFCTDFYTCDSIYISEKYGSDAVSYQEQIFDIITKTIFFFDGIQGFADYLYDPSNGNWNIDDDGNISVSSGELVDFIEQQNTTNTPKGQDLFKQTVLSDPFFRSFENHQNILPLFDDEKKTQFWDLYLVPYFSDADSVLFFSNFQFHIYYLPCEDRNADYSLYLDTYRFAEGVGYVLQPDHSGWVGDFIKSMLPYSISIGAYLGKKTSSGSYIGVYDLDTLTSENYFNGEVGSTYDILGFNIPSDVCYYYSNDGTEAFVHRDSAVDAGMDVFDLIRDPSSCDPDADIGFICSKSLIKREYNIDTSKIPPNQIINITGDTIYDYSITNPDTGASTTINEYVTNNYYYPEAPSTSEPSGGGSGVGGNVTVGGNINVGGQVGVDITVSVPDININVNDNGGGAGGSGTGINPDDILDGSSVDLDKYYDEAVSQASGVRSFLSQFFDFLPAEIIGLLGLLIAVAIVCRLFGR